MDMLLTWRRAAAAVIASIFTLATSTASADTPTTPRNIDPDSFGHNMIFLGLATTSTVSFANSCADPDLSTPPARCIEVGTGSAPIDFSFPDLGSILIPANSTKTIIWPVFIQNAWWRMRNTTGAEANGVFRTNIIFTFESDVLKDPSAMCPDPETGDPVYCNGRYVTSIPLAYGDNVTLAPGEQTFRRVRAASTGIGAFATAAFTGIVPEKLLKKMFASPMIIRFGIGGRVSLVDPDLVSMIFVGVRLIGDQ